MKPEDFILNTDYLSLSIASHSSNTVTFGSGTVGSFNFASQTIDVTVPKANQASFQYMISPDNSTWYPTNHYEFNFDSNIIGRLLLSRINSNTLRVYLFAGNKSGSSASYPSKQFWIKEAAIIAPDMDQK